MKSSQHLNHLLVKHRRWRLLIKTIELVLDELINKFHYSDIVRERLMKRLDHLINNRLSLKQKIDLCLNEVDKSYKSITAVFSEYLDHSGKEIEKML